MRKLFSCFSLLLFFTNAFSQDFSNKGKDFWISYAGHIDTTASSMGIYITSDVNASGTITVGTSATASTTIPYTVTANNVTRIFLGLTGNVNASNNYVYLRGFEENKPNAAIHVTSDRPVAVYSHIIRSARSGATLVLPVNVWGKEYIVPSHQNTGTTTGYGEVNIMAADTNTVVEITPSIVSRNRVHAAGTPYTIVLNPGSVYQLQFAPNEDISGTKIRSVSTGLTGCKPIGVYSATTWSGFNCSSANGGDNLYQQLFPLSSWGKNFLTAPFINRNYDIVRVFVSDPATVVTKTENGVSTTLSALRNNSFYQYITNNPTKINADKPISVVHYITSQSCGDANTPTDPEMVVLSPVEQTINNITVFSAHRNYVPQGQSNVNTCYLNIVIPTVAASSFKINGTAPFASFIPIQGTNYSYLQESVTGITLTNPVQTLTADSSFSAIAYGYGNTESYGYNAGTNIKDLYQHVIIRNQYATVDFPATCINTPFRIAITLPYLAQSLSWDFHGAFTNITNSAPTPDSSYVVDNKTVYVYRLPLQYTFNTVGAYPVSVTAINPTSDGCSGVNQIDYDIEVYQKPHAAFYVNNSGCLSDSLRFYDTTNGLGRPVNRWKWQFGDNTIDSVKNPVKLYGASGTYNVYMQTITDVGCIADTTIAVNISPAPTAKFGTNPLLCPGLPVTFNDSSTIATGTIVKWYWDYGNGKKDTLTTGGAHSFVYDTAGTYKVTLITEGAGGCKGLVFTKMITIHVAPDADFQTPVICMPSGIGQFTNASTIADGTQAQLTYLWNFGDGTTGTAANPSHVYTTTGSFNIKLTVTSNNGCIDTTTKILSSIYAQPQALFTSASSVCLGDSIAFTNQSTATNNTIAKWFWRFDDGQTDTLPNPKHLFRNTGTYNVKLYVLSTVGCYSDTLTKQVVVSALPIANFTIGTQRCLSQGITLTSTSTTNLGAISNWQWNFGDGRTLDTTSGVVVRAYDTLKTYNVSLTVTNDAGCRSTAVVKPVAISTRPVASFGVPQVCLNDPFAEFTDSSTISDGTAASLQYRWNFGDPSSANNISTIKNGRHSYTTTGVYSVTLTVTSSSGCTNSITKQITINGGTPTADFSVQNTGNICSADTVSIQNKSTVNFGSITKVQVYWDYANQPSVVYTDSTPSFNKVYPHIYSSSTQPTQVYTIRLLAYSGGVCVSSVQKTITVYKNPVAAIKLNPDQICVGSAATFTDTSTNNGLNISNWAWTFSDGRSATTQSVAHTFTNAGTFTARLQTQTADGCFSPTVTKQLTINAVPLVNAGSDIFVLEGGKIQIKATANGSSGYKYVWSPATWLNDANVLQPVTTPQADITYTLTVTGAGNCTTTDDVSVKILKGLVIPNAFSPNGDGINDKWVVQYLESYPGSTVQVYDRYGQVVFNAPVGYNVAWDGTLNGKPLPIGTYFYIIDPKNGRKPTTGSVTILR